MNDQLQRSGQEIPVGTAPLRRGEEAQAVISVLGGIEQVEDIASLMRVLAMRIGALSDRIRGSNPIEAPTQDKKPPAPDMAGRIYSATNSARGHYESCAESLAEIENELGF